MLDEKTTSAIEALMQIGAELSTLRLDIVERAIQLDDFKTALEIREYELMPPEGWPGKNADQRKWSRDAALEEDTLASGAIDEITKADRDIKRMAAKIQGLEDRRRAIEFVARVV